MRPGSLIRMGITIGLCAATLAACGEGPPRAEPVRLGGEEISAERIERGRFAYGRYCRRCHGPTGRGDGPHGVGLPARPRDLTTGVYPQATGGHGERLPSDAELASLIRRGVPERGMPAFDLDAVEIDALVQYSKFLSARWRIPPRRASP